MLKHRGYTAAVELDAGGEFFRGRIAGIEEVVTFEGVTARSVGKGFEIAVDEYMDACRKRRVAPEVPDDLPAAAAVPAVPAEEPFTAQEILDMQMADLGSAIGATIRRSKEGLGGPDETLFDEWREVLAEREARINRERAAGGKEPYVDRYRHNVDTLVRFIREIPESLERSAERPSWSCRRNAPSPTWRTWPGSPSTPAWTCRFRSSRGACPRRRRLRTFARGSPPSCGPSVPRPGPAERPTG
jgi:hypothetical protein